MRWGFTEANGGNEGEALCASRFVRGSLFFVESYGVAVLGAVVGCPLLVVRFLLLVAAAGTAVLHRDINEERGTRNEEQP
jgi:hypothetical protein